MYEVVKERLNSLTKGHDLRFLETNSIGGFSTHSLLNSNVRAEDGLLIASITPPIDRVKMVQKFEESIILKDNTFSLYAQEYLDETKNIHGYEHLVSYQQNLYPKWNYQVGKVLIEKKIIMVDEQNTTIVIYNITNNENSNITFKVKPLIAGYKLGDYKDEKEYEYQVEVSNKTIGFIDNKYNFYINSNATFEKEPFKFTGDFSYKRDVIDGRSASGSASSYGTFEVNVLGGSKQEIAFVISMDKQQVTCDYQKEFEKAVDYKKGLLTSNDPFENKLILAANDYVVHRKNTYGKTIIAGYPFFGDWGRDTFWALKGCTLIPGRFDDAKSILVTFIKHMKNGLIPNMFPENDEDAFYNTIDAPLLFINSAYDYYLMTKDIEFLKNEMYSAIESIIKFYEQGTDYNIHMQEDNLVAGGEGLLQLTWMDVRFESILPTPRHGKPVEINALWYNAMKIMAFFTKELGNDGSKFENKAILIKHSFNEKFISPNGLYLKDVLSGLDDENQIRSNQIWAVSVNFSPVNDKIAKETINTVYNELYTPLGIRTLSPSDKQYIGIYQGSQYKRDMAYHQGTVWPFIMGGFIIGYLKVNNYSSEAKEKARLLLNGLETSLEEGCIGQIAEVFDGDNPLCSKGCYAQAWSVAELLNALSEINKD